MLAEVKDIYTLFIQDDSISDAKKKNLTPLYKPANSRLLFLAKLISFGMERQFIKRNTKNQKLLAGIGKSELAKAYAKQYMKHYTNILYVEYTGNLHQDITDINNGGIKLLSTHNNSDYINFELQQATLIL